MSDLLTLNIPRVEAAVNAIESATLALAQGIEQHGGWAYFWYQDENEPPVELTDPAQARQSVVSRIRQSDYQSESPKRVQVGAAAVSSAVLTLAQVLNRKKEAFEQLRGQIRAELAEARGTDDARYASRHVRQCLKRIGHGRMDLAATGRKIPLMMGTALRLRWHFYSAPPTQKRTLADVVRDLQALLSGKQYASDEEQSLIASEITRLGSLDQRKAVAYRMRQGTNIGVRYSGAFTVGNVKEYVRSQYGASPVLFLDTPGIYPTVTPFAREGISERAERKRISNEPVTRVYRLSGYLWYLTPKTKAPEPDSPPDRPKNPYAGTGFPGLSFWARPSSSGLTPHIRVLKADGRVTQISIDKHGYELAWKKAAAAYVEGRENITVEAVIAKRPPPQRYREMVAWAEMRAN
ncbi:hypothetical protein [Marinimicrobium sp. ABcell2]|uniref:hypothetical protein n=1 Tax=Marinimicrobium sp. ABcell2 TaxID=3069751 RepID=UPI0027AF2177|nr:hypothetical protein [Marinimicrobium sp. ABcell2]MDQ2077553.1 hypothetical protein [Marinimicrobium sp. ABcell2]